MSNLSTPPSFPSRYRVILSLLVVLVVVSGVEPTFSVSPFAFLTTACTTLTPSAAAVLSGSSGMIRFACGVNPALTVSRSGLAKPLFTLPGGYTTLTIVAHVPGGTTCSPGSLLVSSVAFNFASIGSFDYCALYSNAPASGLTSFTLTWMKAVPKGAGFD